MKKVLVILGTRPEAIKLAPVINELKKRSYALDLKLCVTGQHREMLDQILSFFKIAPDFDLKLMTKDQTLYSITADAITHIEPVVTNLKPDWVMVQGDTTTAFAGALCGFYCKAKIAHIEAGLRSGNLYSPYPEEGNRSLISRIATHHFTPTRKAEENLKKENITGNIFTVGNSVIDAFLSGLKMIIPLETDFLSFFNFIDFNKRIVLVTGHRRESFGKPFEEICHAIKEAANRYPSIEFVYPVHLNPHVKEPVYRILNALSNVKLIEPLDYPHFIFLMKKAYFILTDSGGIQEEAPSIGKPVLVMRDVTERIEGVEAGSAKLVGTNGNNIRKEIINLIENTKEFKKMSVAVNPYGDGLASKRIADVLESEH